MDLLLRYPGLKALKTLGSKAIRKSIDRCGWVSYRRRYAPEDADAQRLQVFR